MKGFSKAKKLTAKQSQAKADLLHKQNKHIIAHANSQVDRVCKIANHTIADMGQEMASAEVMIEVLKELIYQVINKKIYPHELKRWIDDFESLSTFEGSPEEMREMLGLSNVNEEHHEIYSEIEKRIGARMAELDIATASIKAEALL